MQVVAKCPKCDAGLPVAAADAPAAPAVDELRQGLLTRLQAGLGDAVVGSHVIPGDDLWARVRTDAWVAAGQFVEHAEYAGNRYGTLKSELSRPARGIVLEIDVQGARQVREALPEAKLIFIEPPSFEDLERRLAGRGSDRPEQIERRLAAARDELAAAGEFDYRIVNDDLQRALQELSQLAATMS